MRYYPIFLDVRGQRAVVVGGGKVAERKVRTLLRAGASVRVISPDLTRGLQRLRVQRKIRVALRRFRKADIGGGVQSSAPFLVFAATDDPAAQFAVRKDARAAGALVNVADNVADCDFIVPASFTRGNLHIAISTSGNDPALARFLRRQLAAGLRKGKGQRAKGKGQK